MPKYLYGAKQGSGRAGRFDRDGHAVFLKPNPRKKVEPEPNEVVKRKKKVIVDENMVEFLSTKECRQLIFRRCYTLLGPINNRPCGICDNCTPDFHYPDHNLKPIPPEIPNFPRLIPTYFNSQRRLHFKYYMNEIRMALRPDFPSLVITDVGIEALCEYLPDSIEGTTFVGLVGLGYEQSIFRAIKAYLQSGTSLLPEEEDAMDIDQ